MTNLNKVFLIGRLSHDPELRFTPQGTAVADLSVAVNRVTKNPDGTNREEVAFLIPVDQAHFSRRSTGRGLGAGVCAHSGVPVMLRCW